MSDVTVHPVPPPEADDAPAGAPPPPRDGGPRRRFARRQTARLGLVAALVLAAGAAVALVALTRHDRVRVPAVVGRDAATAARLVREAGLRVRVEQVPSPRSSGTVVEQQPGPRSRADRDSAVVVRISSGPGLTTVPEVRRQPPTSAARSLRAAGLGFTVLRRPTALPAGLVASVTPPGYSQVNRGTRVTLVVSTGPGRVRIPKLLGLPETTAQKRLARAGLAVVIVREESSQPAGQVIAQQPQAGTRRRKGADARLIVAAAPPRVPVPAVSGLDLESAVTTLSGLGLRIAFRDRRGGAAGTVLTQDPPARSSLPRGGTITLTVARG